MIFLKKLVKGQNNNPFILSLAKHAAQQEINKEYWFDVFRQFLPCNFEDINKDTLFVLLRMLDNLIQNDIINLYIPHKHIYECINISILLSMEKGGRVYSHLNIPTNYEIDDINKYGLRFIPIIRSNNNTEAS